jgi:hypothetical protein
VQGCCGLSGNNRRPRNDDRLFSLIGTPLSNRMFGDLPVFPEPVINNTHLFVIKYIFSRRAVKTRARAVFQIFSLCKHFKGIHEGGSFFDKKETCSILLKTAAFSEFQFEKFRPGSYL